MVGRMNQLDTLKKHPPHKVVVVTKTDGIQGPSGKNGITPHIDKKTGNWFISNVDTGVKANGLSEDDITLLHLFDTEEYFPKEGNPKDIYIAKNSSTMYLWNTFSLKYDIFKPNYVINIEHMLGNVKNSISNSVLKKPDVIRSGALLTIDSQGNTQATDVTYEELLQKINSSNGCQSCDGCLPKNLVPGALLVGSEEGSVDSSDISYPELISAIEASKKSAKFVGKIVTGSLVLTDENGNLKSSEKTFNQLIEDIQKSSIQSDWNETNKNSPAFIKNKPDFVSTKDYIEALELIESKPSMSSDIIPGALVIADKKGNLRCSEIQYDELKKTLNSIVTGSKADYTFIEENEIYIVKIPDNVKRYPSISVYHNGNFLMEGLHYTMNKGFIMLNGFFAYKADIFSFVGYGSVTPSSQLPSTPSIPSEIPEIIVGSKSEYTNIKEDKEKVITIPKSIRVYPAINVYHTGILLIEGLHYSIDRDFITLNGFVAYKNDVFNFVGYGSASLITDENNNTNHSHANKTILDTIIQDRVDAWDTITTHNHDHAYVKNTEIISPALLPIAGETSAGIVKSSKGANKVFVNDDGSMTVESVDVSTLVALNDTGNTETGEDFSLILSSGSAFSYKH